MLAWHLNNPRMLCRRNPPKGLGPTVLGGIALAAAESFAKGAGNTEAEVRIRLQSQQRHAYLFAERLANSGR